MAVVEVPTDETDPAPAMEEDGDRMDASEATCSPMLATTGELV